MRFVVVGLGIFGRRLARDLFAQGHEVLAIDQDEEPVEQVQDEVTKAVIGDATREELVQELVSSDMDAAVVAIGTSIENSLLATLHLREIGVPQIHVKANRPEHATILRRIGVTSIVQPEEDAAQRTAELLGHPKLHDFFRLQDDATLLETEPPEAFLGHSLRELELRSNHGIQVVGIRPDGSDRLDLVPSPDREFRDGDAVLLVGPPDNVNRLLE